MAVVIIGDKLYFFEPFYLHPEDKEPLLYDIKGFNEKTGQGDDFFGSRRTLPACHLFMTDRPPPELSEDLPHFDHHVRLRKAFLTFGEPWWFKIVLEIERREAREAKA